jgi:hypothetical protein
MCLFISVSCSLSRSTSAHKNSTNRNTSKITPRKQPSHPTGSSQSQERSAKPPVKPQITAETIAEITATMPITINILLLGHNFSNYYTPLSPDKQGVIFQNYWKLPCYLGIIYFKLYKGDCFPLLNLTIWRII